MLEASEVATAIPSLWLAFNSWFTPAVLFLFFHLMIATIALTSSLTPSSPPSHLMHPYHQQQEEDDEGSAAAKQPPSISNLDRVKSLGLFSPSKLSPQQRQPPLLIPPEEVDAETVTAPMDPFEKQRLGQHESTSPTGKFESFDLYRYLPQEPASEIPWESNPVQYIFEQTHPQERFCFQRSEMGRLRRNERKRMARRRRRRRMMTRDCKWFLKFFSCFTQETKFVDSV